MAGKLTDTKIKSLKYKDKDYVLTDGSGLQINIRANKTKRWEFIYKSPTTLKRRKFPIGLYPDTTLGTARKLRGNYIDLIKNGIDPIDKKRDDSKQEKDNKKIILKNIADEWLEYEEQRTTAQTHKRKKGIIENDLYPVLGTIPINKITHQDIIKVIELRLKKTIRKSSTKLKQNDGIETANKLFNYMNTIFKFAITKGLCKYNPFNDIVKDLIIPHAKPTHNPKLTNNDDIEKLVNDIYSYKGHYSTINSLKFALHIPLRASNLVNLKWEYINFDEKSLTIPRELMKIKNHNLPDFKVPLSDEVIKILEDQKELTYYQEYIFLSVQNKPMNENTPNGALKRMGYQDKQTLHGLRGTYRSLADTYQQEHNISDEAKEVFLDHYEGSATKKAYTHQADYFEQMKPLVIWWSSYINNMLNKEV